MIEALAVVWCVVVAWLFIHAMIDSDRGTPFHLRCAFLHRWTREYIENKEFHRLCLRRGCKAHQKREFLSSWEQI